MNRCIWILAVLLACAASVPVWAQAVPSATAEAQRQRISAERARAEADLAQQEQACYGRFVVQSCLDTVAAQRRTLERELKRQEAVLNAADRQQRAKEQLERSAEKLADQQVRASELPANTATERALAQQEKQKAHKDVAVAPERSASKALPALPDAAQQAAQREAHASKLRAAQERRDARDKRLRESKEARPVLPTPR